MRLSKAVEEAAAVPAAKEITLRWLTGPDPGDALLSDALGHAPTVSDRKDAALLRLGIVRQEGEGHLAAWLRVMHEENGLEYSRPAHSRIRDAVEFSPADLSRWVWWLA